MLVQQQGQKEVLNLVQQQVLNLVQQ
ncbi:hypothetical protein MTR67_050602 [Solanum verrucosum]|uniref:Uncharacterized protein n=1 Tax=Solanum verrucosum TaxID=315347 RepID=A0AAF0V2Q7_SOLVR|nr:hypothetical protein MTR67_050602 [Solanum verrucosum]